jgi:CBS domain-containing protein
MKSIKAIVGQRDTITINASTSIAEAARVMTRHQIGALPVLQGERLAGIFSERDVLGRIVAEGRDPQTTSVRDAMSTDLVVADIGESCDDCLNRMQQSHVRHLIVLDQGRLAGILSLRDILSVELAEKDEAITLLNAYIHYIPVDQQRLKT